MNMKFLTKLVKHILKNHLPAALVLLFLIIFAATIRILAVAPDGGYAPGATLDPACLPGATDCVVTIPTATTISGLTQNYLSKSNASGTNIADSLIFDDGTFVGIGTATPTQKLDVNGNISIPASRDIIFGFSGTGDQEKIGNSLTGDSATYGLAFTVGNTNQIMTILRETANIGIGTATPDASSILDLTSTAKGFLPPRMTKAQRDLISSPATGLTIFQTDNTPGLRVYNGTNWMRFTETAD